MFWGGRWGLLTAGQAWRYCTLANPSGTTWAWWYAMSPKTGPVRLRYRLITLWDIMRPFRAVTFLNVLELLNLFQTHERAVHVNDRLNKFLQKSGELPVENEHDFGDVRSTGLHCFTEMEPDALP
jgi:hypothetical protein